MRNVRVFTEKERLEIRDYILTHGRAEARRKFKISSNATYKFVTVSEFRAEKDGNRFRNMCIVCNEKRVLKLFCKAHYQRYIGVILRNIRKEKIEIMKKYGL